MQALAAGLRVGFVTRGKEPAGGATKAELITIIQ
jgi:hypothetical protein